MSPTYKRYVAPAVFLLLCLAVLTILFARALYDPKVNSLFPCSGAEWIRCPPEGPTWIRAWNLEKAVCAFRKRFKVNKTPYEAPLELRALKNAEVFLDGRMVLSPLKDIGDWKEPRFLDLAKYLKPGEHEIVVYVENDDGPPALWLRCKGMGLSTGADWETSSDGKNFKAAAGMNNVLPAEITTHFPRADKALISRLPYLSICFVAIFLWTFLWYGKEAPPDILKRITPSAASFRWIVFLMLGALWLNDAVKLNVNYGYDAVGHMEYISYIAQKHRLPVANEGLMMFHPPLYYLISALFHQVFSYVSDINTAFKSLRAINVTCGILQVELTYRALKHVFPDRHDLQAAGTLVGGLIPINLNSSIWIGNEAFAALFMSVVLVMCFKAIRSDSPRSLKYFLVMGLVSGLAMLSKMTAFMLLPPVFLLILYLFGGEDKFFRRTAAAVAAVLLGVMVVSGWYYLRNKLALGSFNIGDWDKNIYRPYWQEPGYRTLSQFYVFGRSLLWPAYAGIYGFWDGLYSSLWMDGYLSTATVYNIRPPWNDNFMLSSVLLAILPSFGVIAGFSRVLLRPSESIRNGSLFAALTLSVFFSGFVYHYLKFPIYSVGKASYMLGAVTCLAVLCANGLDLIIRYRWSRALTYALLACWASATYLAYFIL